MGLSVALLVASWHSLLGGVRFLRHLRAARGRTPAAFTPPVTLIVPCRAVDPGLRDNLRAFFAQDYPDFQLLVVTGEASDASVRTTEQVRRGHPRVPSRLLVAGTASDRGQKVHNLLYAVTHRRAGDAVLAFGDSDIRPSPTWLRYLVGPLCDPAVGATTGFRWYVPRRGNFASVLRSVWNSTIASMFNGRAAPFAWGGAMAVRTETFRGCRVAAYWDRALSDDYALTRAMEDHGLEIRFEPHCLSFSYGDCGLRELLAWSFRQLAVTRVYRSGLWRLALASEAFSHAVLWGGVLVAGTAVAGDGAFRRAVALLVVLLVAIYAVRGAKGWLRLAGVRALFPREARLLQRWRWGYLLWGPLSGLVTLLALLRSATTRRIEWRGIRYEMVSPDETVVLGETGNR